MEPVGGGLGVEAEADLWTRARQGDLESRKKLIEGHRSFARAVASRLYARRPNDEVEFDDYLQLAHVGMLEAVDRFTPGRGARFTTFAMPRIRGAVLNGLERLTERRQQWAARRRVMEERVATLVTGSKHPFGDGLLDELGGIGISLALGALLEGTGLVPAGEAMPDDAYSLREVERARARVWDAVKLLTPREREVVERHYGQGKRFEAVASELEVTRGRVSQLHRQALERLRTLIRRGGDLDVAY